MAVSRHAIKHLDRAGRQATVAVRSHILAFGSTELVHASHFCECGMGSLRKFLHQWHMVDIAYTLTELPWSLRGREKFAPVTDLLTKMVRAGAAKQDDSGSGGFYLLAGHIAASILEVARALEIEGLIGMEQLGQASFKLHFTPACLSLLEPAYVLEVPCSQQTHTPVQRCMLTPSLVSD
jgi:hypothetical protein